jgi:NAD(P)-dependent dehydrogenase (short-subunit alcohol dehydrogenase family)
MTTGTLDGHTALVTGGSRGIGAAIVRFVGSFTLSVCLTRERARFFLIQLNLREAGHSGTAGRHGGHAWIS